MSYVDSTWLDERQAARRIAELEAQLKEAREMMAPDALRDYFAAAALQGMLAANTSINDNMLAKHVYGVADAMLTARK